MAKKRAIGRYPWAFRRMAVERLKSCDNIVALSKELGVHRRLLYKWRDQLEPMEDGEGPPAKEYCYGTISSNGGPTSFQAVSATVAGGFGPTNITVTAYNNGTYVGSSFYSLSTQMQTLNFPSSWGNITQLTFQIPDGGDLVFYDLSAYLLGG